jgi:hypothetical protein
VSILDDLRELAAAIRDVVPESLNLRDSRVYVRTRTWTGNVVQLGECIDSDVEILPRPLVKETGGDGSLRVGPVTPAYVASTSGGTAYADLTDSSLAHGQERLFVVTGPEGERLYRLTGLDTSRDFSWFLNLTGLERVQPY